VSRSRRRFLLFIHGLTALAHVAPGLALARWLTPVPGLAATVALFTLTTLRLRALALDRKRPRWQTLLIDEPLFCHWGAGTLAFLLMPLWLVAALVAYVLGWVSGSFIAVVGGFAYATGLLIAAWCVYVSRRRVQVRTVRVELPELPPALGGYRIAQLSDLHVGSFSPRREALAWAARANALEADVVVVTGDLVASGTSFYEDVADVIGSLHARDGVYVVLGNHDQWDSAGLVRLLESRGAIVLQNAWRRIERNGSTLVLAGLGDRYTQRDDMARTLADRPGGAPTVLLAHYPQSFEQALPHGVELVLSGHTHGGQFGVPFFADHANLAALFRQRGRGLVRKGKSQLYVNAGLGTTGPPMRLGVLPEIALLVLEPSRDQSAAPNDPRN
jgi:predicted MPP superfamily phosphohydrolase